MILTRRVQNNSQINVKQGQIPSATYVRKKES